MTKPKTIIEEIIHRINENKKVDNNSELIEYIYNNASISEKAAIDKIISCMCQTQLVTIIEYVNPPKIKQRSRGVKNNDNV
jgi:hypothetical protein